MPPPLTPEFWARDGLLPSVLQPLAWAYAAGAAARQAWTRPWRAPVPVVCVGNLVAGGAGKTPVVLSLAERLKARGVAVHCLSRGYGGEIAGPVAVDRARHGEADVGDEPLLLAATAPTWVARERVAGAKAAVAAGAGLLLLDDGLQNPTLARPCYRRASCSRTHRARPTLQPASRGQRARRGAVPRAVRQRLHAAPWRGELSRPHANRATRIG